jgi:hypothetical protein
MDGVNGMSESDWRKSFIGVAETMLAYVEGMVQMGAAFDSIRVGMEAQRETLRSILQKAHDAEIDGLFNDGGEAAGE